MTLARLIEDVERGTFDLAMMEDNLPTAGDSAKAWDNFIAAFNGSLDAAKRLHDALVPGWRVEVFNLDGEVVLRRNRPIDRAYGDALNSGEVARAWLLAILRAMEGRDG